MMYTKHPTPGHFEHRSGDCTEHGVNIAFARPFGSHETHRCVACLLRAAQQLEQSMALAPALAFALGDV